MHVPKAAPHKRFRIFVVAVLPPGAAKQPVPVEYTLQVRVKDESAVKKTGAFVDPGALMLLGDGSYSGRYVSSAAVHVEPAGNNRQSTRRRSRPISRSSAAELPRGSNSPPSHVEQLRNLVERWAAIAAMPSPLDAMHEHLRGTSTVFTPGARANALMGDEWFIMHEDRPLCISIFPNRARLRNANKRSRKAGVHTAHATPFLRWNPDKLCVKGMAVLYNVVRDAHGKSSYAPVAAGYMDPEVVRGAALAALHLCPRALT